MKKITAENCDPTSAYERTILFNNSLGLTPKGPRFYIVSDKCYGLYDDYTKARKDSKYLPNCKFVHEPTNNGWKAAQKCYNDFYRRNGRKYIIEPITEANQLVYPRKAVLFDHIKG